MIELRVLSNEEIERNKWDSCVHYGFDSNPFGYSWALDSFQKGWSAIVEGDYQSVLPIHHIDRKTVFHPEQIPFLGLYSKRNLSQRRVDAFYSFLKESYNCEGIQLPRSPHFHSQTATFFSKLTYGEKSPDFENETHRYRAYFSKHVRIEQCNKPEEIANYMKVAHKKRYHPDKIHAAHRFMYNCLHRGIGTGYKIMGRFKRVIGYQFYVYSHSTLWPTFHFFTKRALHRNVDAYVIHQLTATYKDQFMRILIPDYKVSALDKLLGYQKESLHLFHSKI